MGTTTDDERDDQGDDEADGTDAADHAADDDPSAVDDRDRDGEQPGPPPTADDQDDGGEIAPPCSDIDEIEEADRVPSTELQRVQGDIRETWEVTAEGDSFYEQPAPGSLTAYGVDERIERVFVGIVGGDDDLLREFTERFGAELLCLYVLEPPEPVADEEAVTTLARASAHPPDDLSSVLAIAADEASARRLWDDHVPDDLEPVDHDPAEPGPAGRYGSLDDVDHDRQAIVSWTSGESGSCPEWLAGLATDGDVVEVQMRGVGWGRSCSDDYRAYTQIVAVDRDRLPDLDALPLALTADDEDRFHGRLGQAVRYPG